MNADILAYDWMVEIIMEVDIRIALHDSLIRAVDRDFAYPAIGTGVLFDGYREAVLGVLYDVE